MLKTCWKVVESVENFVENFSTQNYLLSHPTYYRIRYGISLCQLRHIPISAASKQCVSLSSRHNIQTGQTRNVTLYICQQCITIGTHSKAGAWIDYILLPFPVNIKTYFYAIVNILCEILFFYSYKYYNIFNIKNQHTLYNIQRICCATFSGLIYLILNGKCRQADNDTLLSIIFAVYIITHFMLNVNI